MAFSSDNVEVFLAVIDHGSFSAAARALRRVPSAVSMAIANLEAELDLQLFDRSGREPQPTAAARSLEPQARLLASQLKQLQVQALALTQGLEDRLTLAIAPSCWPRPGPARCRSWRGSIRCCRSRCWPHRRPMRWRCCTAGGRSSRWCSSGPASTGAKASRKWAANSWWR